MSIASEDETFITCLQSEGTILYLDTWCPTQKDLESFPHFELTSRQHWNPHQIQFPKTKYVVQEEIEGRNVSKFSMFFSGEASGDPGDYGNNTSTSGGAQRNSEEVITHDIEEFRQRLMSSFRVTEESALKSNIL